MIFEILIYLSCVDVKPAVSWWPEHVEITVFRPIYADLFITKKTYCNELRNLKIINDFQSKNSSNLYYSVRRKKLAMFFCHCNVVGGFLVHVVDFIWAVFECFLCLYQGIILLFDYFFQFLTIVLNEFVYTWYR